MRQVTLLYHDVVENGDYDASGFRDGAARRYKLDRDEFVKHLDAIAAATSRPPVTVYDLDKQPATPCPVTIGFDDGGVSALTIIAAEFNARGWPAHFFVTTDYIGTPGFLDAAQIRELHAMGHVIGSHSCSHPNPMAACDDEQLRDEWTHSIARLSDILGEPVRVGSIPGGAYGTNVARAAAAAGIDRLFTSEPTTRTWQVDGCTLLGRFGIEVEDAPAKAADFVSGKWTTHTKEYVVWNGKKFLKRAGGPVFYRLRDWWYRGRA
ncbi:MAG: hypothetical protein DWQ31_07685 [Planctomycetota bacterium]|mgnify:CR=1 FL=1|nr:MAG: hypothetical protein DWQ31_07685 [Planctomycetota bacterium]REJ97382.1 MAG: hypothetical protein DWQ35_02160 [Planctomycetota bacterium]REK27707.1 MAG: hypothetical protein DWQ42_07010 [Planctomycetota bacterium]REK38451.1 MAG: hypothetical protein DWQ46_20175 [Planctomycetota bacterium]